MAKANYVGEGEGDNKGKRVLEGDVITSGYFTVKNTVRKASA